MPLKITFDGDELNEFVRVDIGIDARTLENMKAAAMSEAETFLNTDFSVIVINPDGTTTTTAQEAPPAVKDWVLNRIAEKYENRGKSPAMKPDYASLKGFRRLPFHGRNMRDV